MRNVARWMVVGALATACVEQPPARRAGGGASVSQAEVEAVRRRVAGLVVAAAPGLSAERRMISTQPSGTASCGTLRPLPHGCPATLTLLAAGTTSTTVLVAPISLLSWCAAARMRRRCS